MTFHLDPWPLGRPLWIWLIENPGADAGTTFSNRGVDMVTEFFENRGVDMDVDAEIFKNRGVEMDVDTVIFENRGADMDVDTEFFKNRGVDMDMDTAWNRCPPNSERYHQWIKLKTEIFQKHQFNRGFGDDIWV